MEDKNINKIQKQLKTNKYSRHINSTIPLNVSGLMTFTERQIIRVYIKKDSIYVVEAHIKYKHILKENI